MIETHFKSIRKHISETEWLCSRVFSKALDLIKNMVIKNLENV